MTDEPISQPEAEPHSIDTAPPPHHQHHPYCTAGTAGQDRKGGLCGGRSHEETGGRIKKDSEDVSASVPTGLVRSGPGADPGAGETSSRLGPAEICQGQWGLPTGGGGQGTSSHCPPEWHSSGTYTAGPTTVWQMAVVLFEMLHRNTKVEMKKFLINELRISEELPEDYQDFLRARLSKDPNQHPTLEELKRHSWLR
ncbi:uncharacterized protein LOC144464643 [Epinephelus lanceolatus]